MLTRTGGAAPPAGAQRRRRHRRGHRQAARRRQVRLRRPVRRGAGRRRHRRGAGAAAVGVFAAGRIVNAATARSQLIGGMTMGLSMALHEEGVLDPRFGDFVNHDLAEYHIAANADVGSIDVAWLDEDEPHLGPPAPRGSARSASSARPPPSPTPSTTPPASGSATCRSGSTSCWSTSTERRCVARLRESVLGAGIPLGRLSACGLGCRAGRSGRRRHDAAGDRGGERSAGGGADAPPGESCGRGCAPSGPSGLSPATSCSSDGASCSIVA